MNPHTMHLRSTEAGRIAIERLSAELLAAVNASDVDRVLAVWADNGVLMPPHQPSIQGRAALEHYFRNLFFRRRFRFTFTSSSIQREVNAAFERVTYAVSVWPVGGGPEAEDVGKGLHVYRRQA